MRGRRSQFLHLVLVAAFLLVAVSICPAFFLGPLAVLLLLSRPRTAREWVWIAVAVTALVAWLRLPESLSQQTVRAAAAFYVGAFAALTLSGIRSLTSRAMIAATIAAAAMVGWFFALHLRFADLQSDIVNQSWAAWRQLAGNLPATPPAGSGDLLQDTQATDVASRIAASLSAMAILFPALLALIALGGTWLAWGDYQRIARTPLAPAAAPFREFRFNDHLVWLLLASVALALLHPSTAANLLAWNVLVVVLACYCLRGLAITATMMRNAPPLFIAFLVVIMLLTLVFAMVGFVLVGIADTWLDFRRRIQPPSGVPS
ncbi:MAG TPA: DUF2232 domain-containing protein [Gemmatimonadales bacterium]|jgi:hypothetical protein